MARKIGYWRPVLYLSIAFAAVTAVSFLLIPHVRSGALPPIGGLIWHGMALPYLLISKVIVPFLTRGGFSASVTALLSTAVAALLCFVLAALIGIPVHKVRQRRTSQQDT